MADAEAPAGATERRRRRGEPQPATRSKAPWIVGGGIALLAVAGYLLVKAHRSRPEEMAVEFPAEMPDGGPVAVRHALKAGDAFTTTVKVHTGVALGKQVDPMKGMTMYQHLRVDHTVAAEGSGLRSTYVVTEEISGGNLPFLPDMVTAKLKGPPPLSFTLDRDANGRPVPGTGHVMPEGESRAAALEYALSGLTDLTSDYLPPRDVHVGATWDFAESARVGGIAEAIRLLATFSPATLSLDPAGFPKGTVEGRVRADALEKHEGEECVRLKLVLLVREDGEVTAPAVPGRLSAVAKVEGFAWTSLETGVLWGLDVASEVKSSYDIGRKIEERHAQQKLEASTQRK